MGASPGYNLPSVTVQYLETATSSRMLRTASLNLELAATHEVVQRLEAKNRKVQNSNPERAPMVDLQAELEGMKELYEQAL